MQVSVVRSWRLTTWAVARSAVILGYYPGICLEGPRKATANLRIVGQKILATRTAATIWMRGRKTDWGCLRRGWWKVWSKLGEETGDWKKIQDELHNSYASPSIIRMIKRRIRGSGHVVLMGRREVHTQFWLENPPEGRDHSEYVGVDGWIILKCIWWK
jgi:hypothetical protein